EGFRRRQSELTFATLPNASMRAGQMNAPVVDPYTGASYGGDGSSVPLTLQTNFARQVLADLPAPNRVGGGALGVGNNFESLPSESQDDNKGNVKGDYYINSNLTVFGRYSQRELDWFQPPAIPGPS